MKWKTLRLPWSPGPTRSYIIITILSCHSFRLFLPYRLFHGRLALVLRSVESLPCCALLGGVCAPLPLLEELGVLSSTQRPSLKEEKNTPRNERKTGATLSKLRRAGAAEGSTPEVERLASLLQGFPPQLPHQRRFSSTWH